MAPREGKPGLLVVIERRRGQIDLPALGRMAVGAVHSLRKLAVRVLLCRGGAREGGPQGQERERRVQAVHLLPPSWQSRQAVWSGR